MSKDILWSISTTLREPDRIIDFLQTAKIIDGEDWDENSQIKYQILLIKERKYLKKGNGQTYTKLTQAMTDLINDESIEMTYKQAKDIFEIKGYESPAMRGRNSMAPLVKLGLVDKSEGVIRITDLGDKLLDGTITLDEFMLDILLKYQYPNRIDDDNKVWNTKPFVTLLRLILKVNELCVSQGMKAKGLTKIEFGIFALTLKSYEDVDEIAKKVIEFRKKVESTSDNKIKDAYIEDYIIKYLPTFNNPLKNTKEYTDNIVRYLRTTKYIIIRGKYGHACVDIEPRRQLEIEAILEADDGSPKVFASNKEWIDYISTYGAYVLPFETVPKLTKIVIFNKTDINDIENTLGMAKTTIIPATTKSTLKSQIENLRLRRTHLQNLLIKKEAHDNIFKIDETIDAFVNIRKHDLKPSIALEKYTNVALNIINDSKLIKPNTIVGDDNEPTFTAPSGVADIECFYKDFNAICEVTMLTSRDQWYNEGQPVMRHLRQFENGHSELPSYCLFIAPSLHQDTLNTFWNSVKYEYEGTKQKIVPITINQLTKILGIMKQVRESGGTWSQKSVMNFYDLCCDISKLENSSVWTKHIDEALDSWATTLISA